MKRDPNLLQISRPTHLIIDGHLNAHYQCHIVVSKRVLVLSLPRRIPQKMHKALGMLGIWLLNVPKIDPIFHVPPPCPPHEEGSEVQGCSWIPSSPGLSGWSAVTHNLHHQQQYHQRCHHPSSKLLTGNEESRVSHSHDQWIVVPP